MCVPAPSVWVSNQSQSPPQSPPRARAHAPRKMHAKLRCRCGHTPTQPGALSTQTTGAWVAPRARPLRDNLRRSAGGSAPPSDGLAGEQAPPAQHRASKACAAARATHWRRNDGTLRAKAVCAPTCRVAAPVPRPARRRAPPRGRCSQLAKRSAALGAVRTSVPPGRSSQGLPGPPHLAPPPPPPLLRTHTHTQANFTVCIMICFVPKQGLIQRSRRLTRHVCCATLTSPDITYN